MEFWDPSVTHFPIPHPLPPEREMPFRVDGGYILQMLPKQFLNAMERMGLEFDIFHICTLGAAYK